MSLHSVQASPDPAREPAGPMAELIALQLRTWPEHGKFLEASFQGRDPQLQATRERLAELIWRLARTDPAAYAAGYRWTCEAVHEETFHFLRSGSYRRQTFASARQEVYDNPRIMGQYMRGVLFSQLFWPNHSRVMDSYIREFLPQQPEGHSLLEIGPGHGLFCALAAQDPRTGAIEAWDVSRTSLAQTRQHLARLGCPGRVRLVRRDACKPDRERPGTRPPFQGLVLSEVLEHVEDPLALLRGAASHLAPGARLFLGVPVNAPAPDHIYLFRTPEEVQDLVRAAGLELESCRAFPAAGYTETQARHKRGAISCVIIARTGEAP